MANAFTIDLIMYGEDGEVEYGGNFQVKIFLILILITKKIYLESSSGNLLKDFDPNSNIYGNMTKKNVKI